jgi:puromycin-sensitive aminopeptidase
VDALFPEWNMWTQFLFQDTTSAFSLDSLKNSHPIEADVKNPAEISELFDAISYSKGASILRMLEQYLTPEVFQRGLQRYLSQYSYANAPGAALWKAMDAASGQPVTPIMESWIKQVGFPMVQVHAERQGAQAKLALRQQRFLYDNILAPTQDNTLWHVPVTVRRAGVADPTRLLMKEREATVTLSGGASGSNDWIKVNAGQTAFFRSNYPQDELARLRGAVERQDLPASDRLGLENDAYALMRAGFAPATSFLSLAEAYADETDSTVWRDLLANLAGFETLVLDQPFHQDFTVFARKLLQNVARRLGWSPKPGEGHLDAILRSAVLGQLGSYGDTEVVAEARRRFDAYLRDPAALHPDLRAVVFGLVAQEGDRVTYDRLWDLERKVTLHEEKLRFLGALTRPRNRDLLQETLRLSLSPEVRSQDTVGVLTGVAGNRAFGRDMAWDFIKANWEELDHRYGKGGFVLMRLVSITGSFTTLERAREVEQFFTAHPVPSAARTVQQSLERVRINAKWLEKNRDELAKWFAARR